MFQFLINKLFPKAEPLGCDVNSCSCGTKDCIFWKSLEVPEKKVTIESVSWCKTCSTCGFPIVNNQCVCTNKSSNYISSKPSTQSQSGNLEDEK